MSSPSFRRILLPVDGSLSTEKLLRQALEFARRIGACVNAVHVLPESDLAADAGRRLSGSGGPEAFARRVLQEVSVSASLAGVACATMVGHSDEAWRAILRAAGDTESDLICILAHGRPGASDRVGSQTAQVVEHASLPVLVFR
jgi:nucleotide-binding universal stress UspA family protein